MEMFLKSMTRHDIDTMLLAEPNIKWTPRNIDKMEQNLKQLGREISLHVADSNVWNATNKNYLPGGVMIATKGKAKSLLNEEKTAAGALGNWIATHLKHKDRNIIVVNACRIPSSS